MSFSGFEPIVFDRLGGRYDFLRIEDIPEGFSPDEQNCRFRPGSVESRPGYSPVCSKTGRIFYGFSQYIDNSLNKYLLTLDNLGNVDLQSGTGTTPVKSAMAVAGALLKTVPQFNKNYLAFFGSGIAPKGPMRMFDGTNLDEFCPGGPGGKDHLGSTGTLASGSDVIHNVTHIETWSVGDAILDSEFVIPIGQYVTAVDVGAKELTISHVATGNAIGAVLHWGGFVAEDGADAGFVGVGVHGVAVSYVTRSQYITEPSAPIYWNAGGGKQVQFTGLPTGPDYVIGRQIYFTVAGQNGAPPFYLIPVGVINDNTTTSIEIDFADTDLTNGTDVTDLFNNFRLPDQAAVSVYNSRIVAWGGLNQAVVNRYSVASCAFTNAGFDGGIALTGLYESLNRPLGWEAGTHYAGGAVDRTDAYFGGAWKVTGSNTESVRGEILHLEAGLRILPATGYSVSFRAKRAEPLGPISGFIQVNLVGTGLNLSGKLVSCSTLSSTWFEWHGVLCLPTDITSIPNDFALRVAVIGGLEDDKSVWIDHIQVYPTAQQYDGSTLRISDPFEPERFDAVNGFMSISKDDGQRIAACAQLRWYYYIFKDRSMHVTFDDGTNPPSLWSVNQVSGAVGAANPNAVTSYQGQAVTEDFIAIAARPGAYIFFGGKPIKVSQEVQVTWDRINWAAKESIFVFTDPAAKLIYFFLPLDEATAPNAALTLDYVEGFGQENEPGGRKWNLDVYPITIRAAGLVEDADDAQAIYLVGPKVYEVGGTTDDGTAIDAYYETSFARSTPTGTSLFGGASYTVSGSGLLQTYLIGLGALAADIGTDVALPAVKLPDQQLDTPMSRDVEEYANLETERARIRFEVNGLNNDGTGYAFQCKRVAVYSKPWARMRPH